MAIKPIFMDDEMWKYSYDSKSLIWINRKNKSKLELSYDGYVWNVDYTTKNGKRNFTKPYCKRGNALNFIKRFMKELANKITSPSATLKKGN